MQSAGQATALLFFALFFSFRLPAAYSLESGKSRTTHLLLDSRIIDTAENARLTLGSVTKHPGNPLFGEDKPWEQRYDNMYASVIYDREEKQYKLWYNPFIKDASAKGMTLKERHTTPYRHPRRENGICYAFSIDGLKWHKPDLHLIDYENSKKNNLVLCGSHGPGVFRDPNARDPKQRYVMFHAGDLLRFSPDGLTWSDALKCKGIDSKGDTHNNMLFVPELNRYAAFVRLREKGERLVGRSESGGNDLNSCTWTKAIEVLRNNRSNQTYSMPVFRYADLYFGLVAVFRTREDRVHTELAWSPDTITWHRIAPGTPFIGNAAKEGGYDWGCVYAADDPVIREDEIRIYYLGSNGKHTSWREGFFCLATLRPDRWAGYEQVDELKPGVITTHPFLYTGKPIFLTADVQEGGSVKAAVLYRNGRRLTSSRLVQSTVTNTKLNFANAVEAGIIRFRFEINKAKVYSFSTASAASATDTTVSLFDGKTLNGWHAIPRDSASDWSARDGVITGRGSADRLSYLVWEDTTLTDFELTLKYRLPGKGNSGIEIRSRADPSGKRPFEGYHADLGHVGIGAHILGAWDFHFAKRKEYPCPRGTRLFIKRDGTARSSRIDQAVTLQQIRAHSWNHVRITARGNHFRFFINGIPASEFTDNAAHGRLDRGAIGLQIHDKGMQVEFKDILLKRLRS